ncbi:hypothetical protein [Arthrobacter sp. BE255]|uniref:hypothetical protein n=1 Tax=Arthrobacter sp. BE255 TaxID=2817721 RepID=UPI00285F21DC|nr:hypothetical protein [Arthrobacter sp. BE255]MDR7159196.1 hypothetical protein [Arthrobacter sp. BE255]
MSYSEQEQMDRRRRLDYMDVRDDTVGVDVHSRGVRRNPFVRPNEVAISDHVQVFLRGAGIDCQKATPVGIGATAGGPGVEAVEAIFQFMKPIGFTIQAVKFLLAWHGRVAALKRRNLLPQVVVTLLAEHIEPRRIGPDEWEDTARLLALILPDLQQNLESEFPSYNFRYEFHAQGRQIPYVVLRAGDGLTVTDNHVLQMIRHLNRDAASLTLFHREGWFAFPKVVAVNFRVRPLSFAGLIPRTRSGKEAPSSSPPGFAPGSRSRA